MPKGKKGPANVAAATGHMTLSQCATAWSGSSDVWIDGLGAGVHRGAGEDALIVAVTANSEGLGWNCPGCSNYICHTPEEWDRIRAVLEKLSGQTELLESAMLENGRLKQEIPSAFYAGRKFQAEHPEFMLK